MEGLESYVPGWVSDHSPLDPLCVVAACVSDFLLCCRRMGAWELSGTCSLQGPIDGVGVWSSLSAGLPAGCLEKVKQVGNGPRVLPLVPRT